jgi:hypothetical protein
VDRKSAASRHSDPAHCSVIEFLDGIRIAALAMAAQDDPRVESNRRDQWTLDICGSVHNFAAIRWDRDRRCSTFLPRFCPADALQ